MSAGSARQAAALGLRAMRKSGAGISPAELQRLAREFAKRDAGAMRDTHQASED